MKKILFIFVLLGVLAATVAFAMPLENNYPVIGSTVAPTSTKTSMPTLIKYFFGIALIAAAFIAFGALVYGGIKYLTSAGNASQTSTAKDMIFSAFLGLGILLLSWLMLGTINPKLTSTGSISMYVAPGSGVVVTYADGETVVYQQSIKSLEGTVKNITFEPKNYGVNGYTEENWEGTKSAITSGNQSSVIKSLEISPKMPGVYLCYQEGGIEICRAFTGGSSRLGEEKSKYKTIKIFDQLDDAGNAIKRYTAITFEKENYGFGGLDVYESDETPASGMIGPVRTGYFNSKEVLNIDLNTDWTAASMAVIYHDPRKTYSSTVKVCSQKDMTGECQILGAQSTAFQVLRSGVNDEVRSIDLQGSVINILCDKECTRSGSDPDLYAGSYRCGSGNKCQIFDQSNAPNSNLTNDPIGTCRPASNNANMPWISNLPCATYYIIKAYESGT